MIMDWGYILDENKKSFKERSGAELQDYSWLKEFTIREDPRAAGMSGIKFGTFEMAKRAFTTMAIGDTLIDSRETTKFLELRINQWREEQSKGNYVRHVYFDKKTHLPARCQTYVEFDRGGRTVPENFYYEWKEMSGIFVPIKIKGTVFRSFEGPNKEQRAGYVTAELNLDWLKINELVLDESYDPKNLTDKQAFADWLDPEKNKATTIIELQKKEAEESELLDKR